MFGVFFLYKRKECCISGFNIIEYILKNKIYNRVILLIYVIYDFLNCEKYVKLDDKLIFLLEKLNFEYS